MIFEPHVSSVLCLHLRSPSSPTLISDPSILPSLRRHIRSRLLLLALLLILDQLNIPLRHLLIPLSHEILNLHTQIALDNNLLPAAWQLRHTGTRRKLLPQILAHFLDVETERFQPGHGRYVFPLCAFDPLDYDLAGGARFGFALRGRGGFVGFLDGVFFGAFLGIDGEGGEVLCEGFCGSGRRISGVDWGGCLRGWLDGGEKVCR